MHQTFQKVKQTINSQKKSPGMAKPVQAGDGRKTASWTESLDTGFKNGLLWLRVRVKTGF